MYTYMHTLSLHDARPIISKRLVKGGMTRIKDFQMRFKHTLTLLAIAALPLGYAAAPSIAQGFEKKHESGSTKAERKRAEQDAIRQAVQRGELLPLPRVLAIAQAKVSGEVVKIELEFESWATN